MTRRVTRRTFDRFEYACAIAASREVPHVLVCIECRRSIGKPRRFIGELDAPICMTCVEQSFYGTEVLYARGTS